MSLAENWPTAAAARAPRVFGLGVELTEQGPSTGMH